MIKNQVALLILILTYTFLAQASSESSFAEVKGIVFNQMFRPQSEREANEFNAYQEKELPVYDVTLKTVFSNERGLENDARRTLSDTNDYYNYIPKKIHANGVCLTGTWNIDKNTPYTGYFKTKSKGLFIGRVSVTMGYVNNNSNRGFGFAGKIFPTLEENEKVSTLNFFTADFLLGKYTPRVLDTRVTNQPESGFNLPVLWLGKKILDTFKIVDSNPMFRTINHVAKDESVAQSASPHWIRLSAPRSMKRNDEVDFRNEILQALKDNGKIVFNIEVADKKDDIENAQWKKIGFIKADNAIVSYGCDRQLHFPHPKR